MPPTAASTAGLRAGQRPSGPVLRWWRRRLVLEVLAETRWHVEAVVEGPGRRLKPARSDKV